MNTFLWTVAVMGGINTIALMALIFLDIPLPPVTRGSRLLDALFTFAIMVWAIVLLSGGAV